MIAGSAGVLVATTVSLAFVAATVAALALGTIYSVGAFACKKNSAACLVSVIAGGLLTYHAGLLASGGGPTTSEYLVFSCCMSAWMAVGGLVKDVTDIDGDAAAGRRTMAVTCGAAATVRVASLVELLIGFCLLGSTFVLNGLLRPAAVVAVGVAVLSVAALLWRRLGSRRQKCLYRAFMWTQYGAHVTVL